MPSLELSPKAVTPYVGEYHFKDELMKVAYDKGKLTATGSAGKCELRALTQTKIYCIDIEVELQFVKDTRGRVVGVTAEWTDHNEEYKNTK